MKQLRWAPLAFLWLGACGGVEGQEVAADDSVRGERNERVLFRSVRVEDKRGIVKTTDVRGELDDALSTRAGRPYRHLDEETIVDEDAWAFSTEDGGTVYGYRVTEVDNPTPARARIRMAPPELGPKAQKALDDGSSIVGLLTFRNAPAWKIPLRPEARSMAAVDFQQAVSRRNSALAERTEILEGLAADAVRELEAHGGRVLSRGRYSAWVRAELPAEALRVMAKRRDLRSITVVEGEVESHWSLSQMQEDDRMGAKQFHARGYDGRRSNAARHNYGNITVGVIEVGYLEDEACFLGNGATCNRARLAGRFRCDDQDGDGNFCEPVTTFPDVDGNSSHGTLVASTIAADYTEGQGDAYELNDNSWSPASGHSASWEQHASGVAPEASVVFFGNPAGTAGFADAFDDAIDLGLDITNSSWGWDTSNGICNLRATTAIDLEVENAFDDGILNVASAGNPNNPGDTNPQCNTRTPADLVKSLSVNATNINLCADDYGDCVIDDNYSAMGGIDAKINGRTYAGAVSSVDLVAPNRFTRGTTGAGLHGGVTYGYFNGTSAAAPLVAGAAAIVKDWMLTKGITWINNPGRLHTMMLAMGDRHRASWGASSTWQSSYRTDKLYGLGRLRLRLFENGQGLGPWGHYMKTKSFTSGSSDYKYKPFGPLPSGTVMVKCVLMQDEDMSSKDDISKIDLEMRLRNAVNGSCNSVGSVRYTRIASSRDTKKVTVIEDGHTTLAGRCLEVTLDKEHVTSQGITTHTYCYYAGIDDDVAQ